MTREGRVVLVLDFELGFDPRNQGGRLDARQQYQPSPWTWASKPRSNWMTLGSSQGQDRILEVRGQGL